jgi:hypothetical protein
MQMTKTEEVTISDTCKLTIYVWFHFHFGVKQNTKVAFNFRWLKNRSLNGQCLVSDRLLREFCTRVKPDQFCFISCQLQPSCCTPNAQVTNAYWQPLFSCGNAAVNWVQIQLLVVSDWLMYDVSLVLHVDYICVVCSKPSLTQNGDRGMLQFMLKITERSLPIVNDLDRSDR